jgi:hypothetical protein
LQNREQNDNLTKGAFAPSRTIMTDPNATPRDQSFRKHVLIALPMIFGAAILVTWAPLLSTRLAQAITRSPEPGMLRTGLLVGFLIGSVALVASCYNLTLGAGAAKPKSFGHWLAREFYWVIIAAVLIVISLRA